MKAASVLQVSKCDHDWEIVSVYNNPLYYTNGKGSYHIRDDKYYLTNLRPVAQKVCLSCGKCVDEYEEAERYFKRQYEEERKRREERDKLHKERKALAKRMWEERCGKKEKD